VNRLSILWLVARRQGCAVGLHLAVLDARPASLRDGLHVVAGQIPAQTRGQTFIEQDAHSGGDQHTFAGFFEEGDGLFAGDGGKILQKNIERITGFEVINQGACGNARAGEARRAAHDFRVNHHNAFRFHGGKITQPNPDRQVVKCDVTGLE